MGIHTRTTSPGASIMSSYVNNLIDHNQHRALALHAKAELTAMATLDDLQVSFAQRPPPLSEVERRGLSKLVQSCVGVAQARSGAKHAQQAQEAFIAYKMGKVGEVIGKPRSPQAQILAMAKQADISEGEAEAMYDTFEEVLPQVRDAMLREPRLKTITYDKKGKAKSKKFFNYYF